MMDNLSSVLGKLSIAYDYNLDTLKSLSELFKSYQCHTELSREVDALLIARKALTLVELTDIHHSAIESMLKAGHADAGFRLGNRFNIDSFGSFNVVLRSTPSLAHAVELVCHYAPQFEAILQMQYDQPAGRLRLGFDSSTVKHWQYEDALMATWQMLRQLTNQKLIAKKLAVQIPQPIHSELYLEEFGVMATFNAETTFIELADQDWQRKVGRFCAPVQALFESWLQSDNSDIAPWLSDVYKNIYQGLLAGNEEFTLDRLALQQHCSLATMKRRLAAQGKTFTQIKDEVMMVTSYHYLTMSSLPIDHVSNWLGFHNPSNFNRACKRWFGCSPKAFRLHQVEKV